jgi:prevent-host-death family protein
MEAWPVRHAKARFSELLDVWQPEGPQVVSRRGIETAVLVVPIEEWRRVQEAARPSIKKLLMAREARTDTLEPARHQDRRRAA